MGMIIAWVVCMIVLFLWADKHQRENTRKLGREVPTLKEEVSSLSAVNKISLVAVAVAIVVWCFLGYLSCSDKRDVTHDPDGYMGYSDEFWDYVWDK